MISSYIVSKAIEYGVISLSDKELYEISFTSLFFSLLTWGTLLVLGILQNCFWGCLIFMASYIPLRVFSGGFHLSTRPRCYMFSLFIFELMIVAYSHELFSNAIYDIWTLTSFPIIAIMSPVEDKKKPLYQNERIRNKKIVYLILAVEAAALLLLKSRAYTSAFFFVSFAPVLMVLQLVLGWIKNRAQSLA